MGAKTEVIVSDVHGDHEALRALMLELGVIDADGKRQNGFSVTSVGDLCHLGHDVHHDDLVTLRLAVGWIDRFTLANHDAWHVCALRSGRWAAMHETPEVHPEIVGTLRRLFEQRKLRVAWEICGHLVTHAGLHPLYQQQFEALLERPNRLAAEICARLQRRLDSAKQDPLFDAVGPYRSGGQDRRPGGVLWMDSREMESSREPNRVPQICGHTPQKGGPQLIKNGADFWVNDVGAALSGKLSALIREPGQDSWLPAVVTVRQPYSRGIR